MDLFGKKKIRELENELNKLNAIVEGLAIAHELIGNGTYEFIVSEHRSVPVIIPSKFREKTTTYSTSLISDLTIQEFFDFYFDGKPIKRKEEVDVEYRKGE